MMNMRVIYISLLMCLTTIAVFAQDSKTALPDLQTAEPDFFDPTRKNQTEEQYKFAAPWRLDVGYVQLNQRTQDTSIERCRENYLHR